MDTMQWIVNITQSLIAALIMVIAPIFWKNRPSIATVKGVASSATMIACWIAWCILRHVFVIAFLLSMLRYEIMKPEPVDRMAVLAITFYFTVFWTYFEQIILRGHWDRPHLIQKDGSLWPPPRSNTKP